MIICINGKWMDEKKAKISVLDNAFLYGDGFYDTMRTYHGQVLELELHLKRLFHSAQVMNIELPWTEKQLRNWIQGTADRNKAKSARVRITVSRGCNTFDFTCTKDPMAVVTCEPLVLNPKDYSEGVSVVTMKLHRVLPQIKTVGLTHMVVAYKDLFPKGIYEALMVSNNGNIPEGASTNLMIVKNGKLITPKSGMLPGLTRKRVMILAKKLGIRVIQKNFKLATLKSADEIFLTNRPREVIPVTRLNGKKVGKGKPGTLTKQLMAAYQQYIQDYFASTKDSKGK
ncbi:MAG: aminotransferase class IV [Patescibacteria group bacterium]